MVDRLEKELKEIKNKIAIINESATAFKEKAEELNQKIWEKKANELIGKCFIYRNNYSCPHWYVHSKVISCNPKEMSLLILSCERDKYGEIRIVLKNLLLYHVEQHCLGSLITTQSFNEELEKLLKEVRLANEK